MTGGSRIPGQLPLNLTGITAEPLPGFPDGARLTLSPGGLSTTMDMTSIEAGRCQYMLNCNVDHGVWKLDMRYRQCQPSPSGTDTVRGFGIGSSYTAGDYYTVVQGTSVYDLKGGWVNSSDALWAGAFNGATTKWETAITPSIEAEDWYIWEHKGYMFYAGGTTGKVRYKPIGAGPLEKLYRRYDLESTGVASVLRPPYEIREWDAGNDTLSQPAGAQLPFQIPSSFTGVIDGHLSMLPYDTDGPALGTCKFRVDFGTTNLDLSETDRIGFVYDHPSYLSEWENAVEFGIPPNCYFKLHHTSGVTWTLYPPSQIAYRGKMFLGAGAGCKAWVVIELIDVPRDERDDIDWIEVGFIANWHDPEPPVTISPLILGGTWWHDLIDGYSIFGRSSTTFPLEYAYAYNGVAGGGSGTPISNATKVDVDKAILMGSELIPVFQGQSLYGYNYAGRQYLGTIIQLNLSTASAPYTSSDKIDIYRKIPVSRSTFEWRRIAQVANTGSPSFTDWMPDSYVYGDTGSYPVATPTFDAFGANLSGEVTGITCGCSWRGSNVYFGNDGKAYFSMQGDFKKVFWDGVVYTISPEDPTRPRTLTVSDQADDVVITAVPNDALYMFTRRAVYAMTGSTPSSAENPRKMPGLRGALGKRAAAQMEAGAIYASESGLYFIEVGSVYTGKPGEAVVHDLTKDVKGTWATLIGTQSESEQVVVAVYDDEIYVACQNRYMRLTKYGHWVYGEYQSGHNVYAAWGDSKRGLVAMLTNGKIVNVGFYSTDLGTNAAGSNGTTPSSWQWKSKRFIDDIALMRAILSYRATSGSASATVKGYTSRNTNPGTLTFTDPTRRLPFEMYVGKETNGTWFEVLLSGTNNTIVEKVEVEVGNYQAGNSS